MGSAVEASRTREVARLLFLALMGATVTLAFAMLLEHWIRAPAMPPAGAPERPRLLLEENVAPPPTPRRVRRLIERESRRSKRSRRLSRAPVAAPALAIASPKLAPVGVELPVEGMADAIVASASNFSSSLSFAPQGLELAPLLDWAGPDVALAANLLPLVAIPPEYPVHAFRMGLSGWVLLVYTVTETGQVTDISVFDAEPPRIFDRAAIDAARKWRYDPVRVKGEAVRVPRVWSQVTFGTPTQAQLAKARPPRAR